MEINIILSMTVHYLSVRSLYKPIVINSGIGTKRSNQTDIWTFRRFNRTNTTIMSWMYIAHFESCSLASQSSRPQRTQATLVSHLRKRVGLIHKLRQLTATEELLNSGSYRFGIDQIMRHGNIQILNRHSLDNRSLHAHDTHTELIL